MAETPHSSRRGYADSNDIGRQDVRILTTAQVRVLMLDPYSYNSHNTKERLGELTAQKLAGILPDKDGRKTVLNAVKGIASGKASPGGCAIARPAALMPLPIS
jgi:hypothetical protein